VNLKDALDIGIRGLDAAGLVSADPRTPGARRPDTVLALAPTAPRELRGITAPGLPLDRYSRLLTPALILAAARSPAAMHRNCEHLAAAMQHTRLSRLKGLGHVGHNGSAGRRDRRADADPVVAQLSQLASSSSAPGRT
jgi:hypothetical protein